MAAVEEAAGQKPMQSNALQMLNSSLYVGDLQPTVMEADLFQRFREMGAIASVRVCKDMVSGESLGYGYVNFFTHAHASKALACLNHKSLKGKPMRIMWCQRDPLRRKTGVGNLFVKNLSPKISSARLQSIFCKFGAILSCKVAEENGRSKGFGFVQFDKEESAMAALNSLNDSVIEGMKIYVSKFVKRTPTRMPGKEPTFTSLYVSNLPEEITEDYLQQKFSEFGKVSSAVIMKDSEGKPKGFGFVNFESSEVARKAMESLNGSLIGSRTIFVGRAQTKEERAKLLRRDAQQKEAANFSNRGNASNLYVKNLDSSVDDRMLSEHFSFFGIITSVKVMRDSNGLSKGFGFVCFSTSEEAKMALHKLNGTEFHGNVLYVAMAQCKEDRSRNLQAYYPQNHPNFWQLHPSSSYVNCFYNPYHNFSVYTIPHSANSQSVVYQIGANPTFPLVDNKKQRNPPAAYYQQSSPGIQTQRPEGNSSKVWTSRIPTLTYSTCAVGAGDHQNSNSKLNSTQRLVFRRKENSNNNYNYRQNQPAVYRASSSSSSSSSSASVAASPLKPSRVLGNARHPLVENIKHDRAQTITSMLLETGKAM